jgi:hypothetical protein
MCLEARHQLQLPLHGARRAALHGEREPWRPDLHRKRGPYRDLLGNLPNDTGLLAVAIRYDLATLLD